ncbi:MAG: glycosyltransferase family 2 protein [Oscillospiraceae bacterium]|nr:glycosyltransferase family 2 protein [Oscillospiraceae bacterium]
MEVTFLLPCLDEAESIGFCIDEIKAAIDRLGLSAEILVADNGSADRSREIALQNGARVVELSDRGYGNALKGGIQAAKGKYVIMGDCDGSYDFSHPERFLQALRSGAALVVGDRFAGGIAPGAMPLSHRIGVPLLSALARWRFHTTVRDFHCGLRGFEREAALNLALQSPGMEFATELIAKFAQSGASIAQVPTPLRCDKRLGKSHLRTFRDGFRHLGYIMKNGGSKHETKNQRSG